MSNDFSEQDFSLMQAEMEKEAKQSSFQSPYWKPGSEGNFPIRIITPLKQFDEKLFYCKTKIHYINGRAYFCLNQTLKDKNGNLHEAENCPLCAKSKQIYSTSQKGTEDWRIAGDLRAKDRYISRVIVRGRKGDDGSTDLEPIPVFWEFGSKIHEYFFNQIKLGEVGNFLSLKDGRDFNLTKKGTGKNTDYSASCLSMKQSPIFSDPEKLKRLLAELPKMDYSQLIEFRSQAEMKGLLDEYFSADDGTQPVEQQSADTLDPYSQPAVSVAVSQPSEEPKEPDSIDDLLNMI